MIPEGLWYTSATLESYESFLNYIENEGKNAKHQKYWLPEFHKAPDSDLSSLSVLTYDTVSLAGILAVKKTNKRSAINS